MQSIYRIIQIRPLYEGPFVLKVIRTQNRYSLYLILSVANVVRYIEVCYKVIRKCAYRKFYRKVFYTIFIYAELCITK